MLFLALVAAAWCALLAFAPLLPTPLAGVLYAVGSRICHQLPARSFHLEAAQLPVCARCLGIYAGAAAGAWAASFSVRVAGGVARWSPRNLLLAGAWPTALTWTLEQSGAWGGSNFVRAGAGVPLGIAIALVVARAVATLHYDECAPRRPIANSQPPTPT